jgi:uncharacterized protein YjgD (DUF1641 family)
MEVNFLGVEELDRLIEGLGAAEKEELAARVLKKLSPEARSRVLGLSESGLTVVTGSFVSLNSDIAVNIQNSSFNPEDLVKALLEYRKRSQS